MRNAILAIVGRLVGWVMDVIADLVVDTWDGLVARHRGFTLVVLLMLSALVVVTWPDLVVMLLWAAWAGWTLFVFVHLNGGERRMNEEQVAPRVMRDMAWGVLLAAVIVWHVDVGVVGLVRVAVVIAALGFGLFCLQEWR